MEAKNLEKVNSKLIAWRYVPPIPCPICSAPTYLTWDENCNDDFGQRLWLRACLKCNKVFTPEPELKLIKRSLIVREEKSK